MPRAFVLTGDRSKLYALVDEQALDLNEALLEAEIRST